MKVDNFSDLTEDTLSSLSKDEVTYLLFKLRGVDYNPRSIRELCVEYGLPVSDLSDNVLDLCFNLDVQEAYITGKRGYYVFKGLDGKIVINPNNSVKCVSYYNQDGDLLAFFDRYGFQNTVF